MLFLSANMKPLETILKYLGLAALLTLCAVALFRFSTVKAHAEKPKVTPGCCGPDCPCGCDSGKPCACKWVLKVSRLMLRRDKTETGRGSGRERREDPGGGSRSNTRLLGPKRHRGKRNRHTSV